MFAFERVIAVSVLLTILALAMGLRFPTDRRTVLAAVFSGVVYTGRDWAIVY